MAQFDVFVDTEVRDAFWLEIQSDLLDGLNTRVVIPLLPLSRAPRQASRLNPIVDVDGQRLFLATQFLAAVPVADLQHAITNLGEVRDDILAATDMLLTGF